MKTFSIAPCMTMLLFSSPNNLKPTILLRVSYIRPLQDKHTPLWSFFFCFHCHHLLALSVGRKLAIFSPDHLLWEHRTFFEPWFEPRWCSPRTLHSLLETWGGSISWSQKTSENLSFSLLVFHSHSPPSF